MSNEAPATPFAPFAPFQPATPAPPLQPEQQQAPPKPETKKQRQAREKREAKAVKDAAAAKKKADAEAAKNAPKPTRHRATVASPKRSPKYDLQTILKIASTLKEGDQKVFEKLLGELSELAKGSRERVLKALGEVFG